jgi:hypothetical protein
MAAATPLGVLARAMLGVVLWAGRCLLSVKANGAVAVEAPNVLRSSLKDLRRRHVLPTLFVQSVDLVKFALLATDHEVMRHVTAHSRYVVDSARPDVPTGPSWPSRVSDRPREIFMYD